MSLQPYARPTDGLRDYYQQPIPDPPHGVSTLALMALAFLMGICAGAALMAAEPCVKMTVRPLVLLPMTRADIRVELRIARHDDHRWYALSWTSDEGSTGSSQRQLEGAESPVTQTHWLKSQPAANYFFATAVYDRAGKIVGRDRGEIHMPLSDGPPLALWLRPGGPR